MNSVAILERTKEYIVVKIPRRMLEENTIDKKVLTEVEALSILRAGMREYREGKAKRLSSLRELRYGN